MGLDHEYNMLQDLNIDHQGNPIDDFIDKSQNDYSHDSKNQSIIKKPEWMMGTF